MDVEAENETCEMGILTMQVFSNELVSLVIREAVIFKKENMQSRTETLFDG